MLDGVPLNIGEIGGWGVAAVFGFFIVLGFARGYLYPSSVVNKMLEEAAARLESEKERADTWQSAWEKCQAGRTVEAEGDRALLVETTRTAKNVLEAIQQAADQGSDDT